MTGARPFITETSSADSLLNPSTMTRDQLLTLSEESVECGERGAAGLLKDAEPEGLR